MLLSLPEDLAIVVLSHAEPATLVQCKQVGDVDSFGSGPPLTGYDVYISGLPIIEQPHINHIFS